MESDSSRTLYLDSPWIHVPTEPTKTMHVFLSSADIFFQNKLFWRIPQECQKDRIQIRPDVLSGLIWVQTVCKRYQQTTLVDKTIELRKKSIVNISVLIRELLTNIHKQIIAPMGCRYTQDLHELYCSFFRRLLEMECWNNVTKGN